MHKLWFLPVFAFDCQNCSKMVGCCLVTAWLQLELGVAILVEEERRDSDADGNSADDAQGEHAPVEQLMDVDGRLGDGSIGRRRCCR